MDGLGLYCYKAVIDRIVDGDTCDIMLDLGCSVYVKERCRLYGINCPESYGVKKDSEEYAKGIAAKERLADLVNGKELIVHTYKDAKGKYGRYLVDIYLADDSLVDSMGDKMSVNEVLVEGGFAVPYFGGKR